MCIGSGITLNTDTAGRLNNGWRFQSPPCCWRHSSASVQIVLAILYYENIRIYLLRDLCPSPRRSWGDVRPRRDDESPGRVPQVLVVVGSVSEAPRAQEFGGRMREAEAVCDPVLVCLRITRDVSVASTMLLVHPYHDRCQSQCYG